MVPEEGEEVVPEHGGDAVLVSLVSEAVVVGVADMTTGVLMSRFL